MHINPEEVNTIKYHRTVAATGEVEHNIMNWNVIHSTGLDHIDDKDWEVFNTSHRGYVDGKEYVWGMFLEGLGCFNVMVPFENIRKLTEKERAYYSNRTMSMVGSHSGKESYQFQTHEITDEEL